jgi:hypothetical protein
MRFPFNLEGTEAQGGSNTKITPRGSGLARGLALLWGLSLLDLLSSQGEEVRSPRGGQASASSVGGPWFPISPSLAIEGTCGLMSLFQGCCCVSFLVQ